jgi:hypothetical protein
VGDGISRWDTKKKVLVWIVVDVNRKIWDENEIHRAALDCPILAFVDFIWRMSIHISALSRYELILFSLCYCTIIS